MEEIKEQVWAMIFRVIRNVWHWVLLQKRLAIMEAVSEQVWAMIFISINKMHDVGFCSKKKKAEDDYMQGWLTCASQYFFLISNCHLTWFGCILQDVLSVSYWCVGGAKLYPLLGLIPFVVLRISEWGVFRRWTMEKSVYIFQFYYQNWD
jgi:hypothetical protein